MRSNRKKQHEQGTDAAAPVAVADQLRGHVNGSPATAQETTLEESGFWDQINRLTDQQWQFHVCYVYRTDPPIRNAGDRNFIEKRTRPFDENDILQTHGSGKYLCILNNTKQRHTIGKISVSCYRADCPPKVRLAQLAPTADDEWRTWLQEAEAQRATAAAVTAAPAAPLRPDAPGGEPSGGAVAVAITHMADISRQLLERNVQANGAGGEQLHPAMVGLLTAMAAGRDELAAKLAERSASPGAPPDPFAQFEKAATVLEKLRPKEKMEPAASPVAQVKEMAEVVAALRDVFGAPATSTEPGGAWLPALIQQAPAILGQGTHLIGNFIALARSWGAQPQATPGGTLAATAPMPAGAHQMPQPAPATGLAGNDVNPAMQEYFQLIDAISSPLLNHLSQSLSGKDFALWFVDGYGALPFAAVKNAGKETLLGVFQMSALWPTKLAPIEVQFSEFLDEFLAFDPNAREDGESIEPEQEPPATAVRLTRNSAVA